LHAELFIGLFPALLEFKGCSLLDIEYTMLSGDEGAPKYRFGLGFTLSLSIQFASLIGLCYRPSEGQIVRKYQQFLSFAAALLAISTSAFATVSLQLVDAVTSGPTNQATVVKGQTFQVRLNLISTSTTEQTTGLDYYLQALGTGSGFFTITDRNISSSPYSDVNKDDLTVEAEPESVLNPKNAWDLGATVANPNAPVAGNTTQLVAFYTLRVNAATPNDSYVIETISDSNSGWIGNAADLFNDHEFNFHGSYNVMVVPEPATLGILTLSLIAATTRRRRGH
jgi:hypothetical protein